VSFTVGLFFLVEGLLSEEVHGFVFTEGFRRRSWPCRSRRFRSAPPAGAGGDESRVPSRLSGISSSMIFFAFLDEALPSRRTFRPRSGDAELFKDLLEAG